LRRPTKKKKEKEDFEIHRVLSSSSVGVPDNCIRERVKCMPPLRSQRQYGDGNGRSNSHQISKSDEAREWN
jgi:hypothetical protein